jgi:hypothetical protein
MIRSVLALLAGIVAIFATQAGLAFLTPATPGQAPAPGDLLAVLLSNALTATMLLVIARRLPGAPARRAWLVFVIWGGIQANSLSELFLFDIGITPAQTIGLIVYGLAQAAAAATALGWLTEPRRHDTSPAAVTVRPWRLAIAPPLYVVCYLGAGMLVWPFIADYYQARPMPSLGPVVALQVVRGLAFGAIVFLIARSCDGGRRERVVIGGLTLAVLGGAAPLVMPNPLMPAAIRLAHLFEVVPSISGFAAILSWALMRPRRPALAGHVVAPAALRAPEAYPGWTRKHSSRRRP